MRHLVALFFCLLWTVASAQPQTFDIASFTGPSDWTAVEQADWVESSGIPTIYGRKQ